MACCLKQAYDLVRCCHVPLPEVVSDFKRTIVGQCPLLDQAGEFGLWCPEHKTLGVPERYQFIDKEPEWLGRLM